jgi:hypothetical protein
MKNNFFRQIFLVLIPCFVILFFISPVSALAAWDFNWSCSSRMGTSSGREGPYANQSNCENALSRARSACTAGPRGASFSGRCSGSDDYKPPPPGSQQPSNNWELDRQRQEEQNRREAEEKKRLQEEEEKRLQEEARKKFEEDKKSTLESLKGFDSGSLTIKSGTDIFGIKGNPEVTLKKPESESMPVTGAWRQLHCAGYISGFALKAAYPKDRREVDIEEVHYLAEQALNALSGAPVGVECPQAPPPPKPYGQKKLIPTSPEVKFYQTLLRATEKQGERVAKAEKQIIQAKAKKQELQGEIKEKKEKVARLQEEIKTFEITKKPTEPVQDKKTDEEKKSAREAALAALRAAEAALEGVKKTETEANKQLNTAEKEKADANARLGEYEKMFNEVRADPGKASEWLSKIKQ